MSFNTFLNNHSNSEQQNINYNMHQNTSNLYNVPVEPIQPHGNRFVYVNQNFVPSTSILINPNFKKTVHINPNFKPQAPVKPKIHVNPHVLKLRKDNTLQNQVVKQHEGRDKLVPNKLLVSTRTKLIRIASTTSARSDSAAKRMRRKSLHTTYKIIRSTKCETLKADANVRKLCYTKSKFKIDNVSMLKHSVPIKSTYRLLNKMSSSLVTKNVIVKNKNSANNSKYLSINGILYKKTPNVLRKANIQSNNQNDKSCKKGKVLVIRGQIYKMDSNQRTLKLVHSAENVTNKINMKRIDIGGLTFKQKEPNVYVQSDINKRHLLVNRAKNKSIQVLANKMKKCNMPCPIYRRFGKCRGKEKGTCIYVHNPNQIALCTRFLQGACLDKNCFLSHKVSPEKMPTCKYFLEGLCSREDCSYLHVKISPKADICKDFLEGFCRKAKECDKRHQFLCPNYEKKGVCVRKRCPYPHGQVVRKFKVVKNKVAKTVLKWKPKVDAVAVEQIDTNLRYYAGNVQLGPTDLDQSVECQRTNLVDEKECSDKSVIVVPGRNRPQLGTLPSFIPLRKSNLAK